MPETCPHCAATGDGDYIARRDCCTAALAHLAATADAQGERIMRLESMLDDMDAAIATLYIGRDHGITPQADGAMRDVCILIRDDLATRRRVFAEVWSEARASWLRKGSAHPVPTLRDIQTRALRMSLDSLNAIGVQQEWDCRSVVRDAIAQAESAS